MSSTERTIAEAECRSLAIAFANHVDARRYDALADLFAPDGVFERRGKAVTGPAAIKAEMELRPAAWVTLHVCTNVLIDVVDADHARGETYYFVLKHDHGTGQGPYPMPGFEAAGIFRDRFVRTAAGWRIAHRQTATVFRQGA